MRAFHKAWQDRRPGWRRRVRWFEQAEPCSIRLNFVDMDEGRECNRFYATRAEATLDYEAFVSGATVKSLMVA